MNGKKCTLTRAALAAIALLAGFATVGPVAAQGRRNPPERPAPAEVKGAGRWSDLKIVIKDVDSGQEIGSLQPGDRVRVTEGGKIRLIMSAYVPGNDKPIYPETVYSEAEKNRGAVRITRASRENANVTLELVDIKERHGERSERVNYQILDERVPSRLQNGSFVIDVVASRPAPRPVSEGGGGGWDRPWDPNDVNTRPGEMTRRLYQAILLRDPDSGARGWTDQIARDGYLGVLRAADAIADSEESRIGLYRNEGMTHERRLVALYQNLLLMNERDIDRRTWDEDLRRLRDGQVRSVVDTMIRSQRFRERFPL
jgi:hypothetical protein